MNAAVPGFTLDDLQPAFDIALHPASGTPHVDDHPGHRGGGDDGERPVEQFLIGRIEQRVAAEQAGANRSGDPPVDGGDQAGATGLAQVGQADGDDEERFEPFPEGDDEGLKERLDHGIRPTSKK